jgi:hypothetical protein
MRKPLTGEPYARKPHVRFGGRGGTTPSLPLCATVSLSSLHSERSVSCEITVHVAEGNCIRTRGLLYRVPRRGGEQPECERAACRITNPFRRGVAASPRSYGEAWDRKEPIVRTGVIRKRDVQLRNVFGGLDARKARQMDRRGLLHWRGAAGVRALIVLLPRLSNFAVKSVGSKTTPREGG